MTIKRTSVQFTNSARAIVLPERKRQMPNFKRDNVTVQLPRDIIEILEAAEVLGCVVKVNVDRSLTFAYKGKSARVQPQGTHKALSNSVHRRLAEIGLAKDVETQVAAVNAADARGDDRSVAMMSAKHPFLANLAVSEETKETVFLLMQLLEDDIKALVETKTGGSDEWQHIAEEGETKLAELREKHKAELRDVCSQRDEMRARAEKAEKDLAGLRSTLRALKDAL